MSMHPYDLGLLVAPSVVIFFVTWFVSFAVTRTPAFSLLAGFIKAGLFIIYFGVIFDGSFTFLDDWSYLEGGQILYDYNVGLTNLVENWYVVMHVGQGEHFAYYLYNKYAIMIFGVGYYAPVALNILLTLFVAWLGTRIAVQEFRLSKRFTKVFFFFILLHPDILAWSNIMNGKDILVLLLHVLLLFSCSLFIQSRTKTAIALAIPSLTLLLFIRNYVPVLFAAAFVTSMMFCGGKGNRVRYMLIGVLLLALALGWLGTEGLSYSMAQLYENYVNPILGLTRFALTPIPFHTEANYAFLNLTALIHWALFPFACWGVIVIYRMRTPFTRFFLFYVLFFLCLYAVYGELQGPRHRVQLDYAWAVLQFLGLKQYLLNKAWFDVRLSRVSCIAKDIT